MSSKSKYLNNIGLLRTFSCLAVLLYHMNLLKGGYLAVCIFFVISGYFSVITNIKKEKFSFIEYYLKKFINLYLPLLIVVFISIAGISLIKEINWFNLKPETTSVLLGYNNFWQLNANLDYFARHVSSPFMHFWYMGIIIQFDLIFPFIFLCLKKLGDKVHKSLPVIISSLLGILSIVYFYKTSLSNNIMNSYYNTFTRIFSLLLGISLGFITTYYKDKKLLPFKDLKINKIIFYLYLIILTILCLLIESTNKYFNIIMIITTIISLRIISYGNMTSKTKLNIFDKVVKFIGKISYEIYLIQYPIIFIFQYINLNIYLEIVLTILVTLLLSYLLNIALDFKNKKRILQVVLFMIFMIPTIFGLYTYIVSKDHTEEMKVLEEKLALNTKMMEERKKEYSEKLKQEQAVWNETMKNLEAGEEELKNVVSNLPIIGIGDSVMLGAVPELQTMFPNGFFDAAVSRTAYKVSGIIRNLSNRGMFGEPILINLGTNGDCDEQTREGIMQLIGNKKIFWVNVTNDNEVGVNGVLNRYASTYSNFHVIDWNSVAKNHPEYFIADGIHLTSVGKTAYINTVFNAIYQVYLEEYNQKKQSIIDEYTNVQNQKITFIGNSLLINAYADVEQNYPESEIITNSNYNYELLEKELKQKINDKSLSKKVVLIFDQNSELTENDYYKLIKLCADYELYILSSNLNLKELNNEKIKIIDFNQELINNKDYLIADGVHLSKKGNERLKELLNNTLK